MIVIVDGDTCIGCGLCADTCDEVFVIEDDGIAHAITKSPEPEQYDCVRDAADVCPVEAISITSG